MDTIQELTVKQYAKIRDVSTVAVTRAMGKSKKLKGVVYYSKVRRDWVLLVNIEEAKKKPKKDLVISE
jgi:hypothetical protein